MQGERTIKSSGGTHVGQLLYSDYGSDEGSPVLLSLTIPSSVCAWMEVVAAARSAALSKILFIYIAIEIFIRFFSQKSSFYFLPLKPCG